MLYLSGQPHRQGDGTSRRGFLRIGSLGFAGFSLIEMLRHQRAAAAGSRQKKAVILFWLAGGPSHIDMYDLKPEAPPEVRGPFRPIDTNLPGLQVCELMPRHAQIADKVALIR